MPVRNLLEVLPQIILTLAFLPVSGGAQELRHNPLRSEPAPLIPTTKNDIDYTSQRDQLCNQAMQLAMHEQWEQALQLAAQALELQQTHIGAEQPETLAILESMAVWQDRAAKYRAAADTWAQLQRLCVKVRGEKHWSTINARLFGETCEKAAQLNPQDQQRLATASGLSFQTDLQMAAGKYAEASELARKSFKIRTELLNADNVVTAISSHLLGTCLLAIGDCQNAQPLLEKCAATREHLCGLKNPATLATLTSLAALYIKIEEPAKARKVLEKILAGDTGVYGPVHPITVSAVNQLGNFELDQNNLADAETLLELAKTQRIKLYHGKHLEIAQTCKSLGTLYLKQRDLAQAEENFRAAVQLYQELAGKDHPDTARALVDLAVSDKIARKPNDAIANLQRAAEIFSSALGKDAPDTVDAIHVLATVLPDVGDYAQAERLYRQVLQSYQKSFSENDQRIGLVFMQLGTLYISWNDFGNAETYLRRALKIYQETLGKSHSDTAGILSMLAMVDARFGRFEQAEQEGKAALHISEETLGKQHSQTIAASLALGNLYVLENKLDDAQTVLQSILSNQPESNDDDRYHNAIIREKLADIALQKGRYEEAICHTDLISKVYEQILPASHPHHLESLKIAAIANLALHHYDIARLQIDTALKIAREQLDAAAMSQLERQQLALNFRLREILDLQLSLPAEQVSPQQAYQNVLLWKGAVQARQIRQRQQLQPEDALLATELQTTITQFATLSLNVPDGSERKQWLKQLDALRQHKETLEAELAEHSQAFKIEQATAAITPDKLQSVLPVDAVLIDVLEYVHFLGGQTADFRDETRYVAFVVRHDRPIVRIDLGAAEPIDNLLETCRTKCLFVSDKNSINQLNQLSQVVWKPLAAYATGCHTILFSPDSNLARFPLAAMPGEKPGTYLIEDFAIGQVPVPRMLPELMAGNKTQQVDAASTALYSPNSPDLLLVGNVDYDAAAGQGDSHDSSQLSKESLGGELLSFESLKSAPEEMRALQTQFNQRYPTGQLHVLEKAAATEAAFRHEAPLNRWLFIATHGFFAAPNVCAALAVQDELVGLDSTHGGNHSGALCGLALAGANQSPPPDGDDGILTAYEISALDLRKVDLVVLSGCETGLGENTPGEGAMSLQRAFQVAGAHTTIASLWNVPDEKTKELMQRFFHNLWDNNMPKLEALRAAQISILHSAMNPATNDLPSDKATVQRASGESATNPVARSSVTESNSSPPYYWAAFVLSGDWR